MKHTNEKIFFAVAALVVIVYLAMYGYMFIG